MHFLSDFRNLNKQLKPKPYATPKINEMLLKLDGFNYSMSLDLNIGHFRIQLSEDTNNLCMLILPREKYGYNNLPIGVINSLDIFKHKINDLFQGFTFYVCTNQVEKWNSF